MSVAHLKRAHTLLVLSWRLLSIKEKCLCRCPYNQKGESLSSSFSNLTFQLLDNTAVSLKWLKLNSTKAEFVTVKLTAAIAMDASYTTLSTHCVRPAWHIREHQSYRTKHTSSQSTVDKQRTRIQSNVVGEKLVNMLPTKQMCVQCTELNSSCDYRRAGQQIRSDVYPCLGH